MCWFESRHAQQELTNDRLGSEADLTRLLGTLRYLQSLKVARQQVETAATSNEESCEQQASTSIPQGMSPFVFVTLTHTIAVYIGMTSNQQNLS